MNKLIILPPAARYIKKIRNKSLKNEFQKAIDEILMNPYIGTLKTGDLAGIYCYKILNNCRMAFPAARPATRRPARLVIFFGLPLESAEKLPGRQAAL